MAAATVNPWAAATVTTWAAATVTTWAAATVNPWAAATVCYLQSQHGCVRIDSCVDFANM
jgi:hypothetical protein